ncbi:hypothetical protein [Novosphingobium album (ex Hu et al. 2023)]|uniref:PRC-barrel domain-containing protein n=1 Tax=Novosphingobium album (ex Hu et al. 2023) TaxID=2930093 RepID=A0ABT0B357_9SPHN|nr:hypothetical protein [Novosphingobium album (ex Hu et al. 2023)]MCJ2179334.1 hypothetical protein [Novosphingobium album (ex Hu et al. 2023)]
MTVRTLFPVFIAALGMVVPAMAQETTDPATPSALANPDVVTVRNISHVELSAGLPIVDERGVLIGTIRKVAGNSVILTDGRAEYRVPVTQLYAYTQDGADHFASRLPRSALRPDG